MATGSMPLSLRLTRAMFRRLGPLFPETFGHLAYRTWFSTTRFDTPQRELPVMQDAVRHEMAIPGASIVVYLWGDEDTSRRTVLFTHGWSGRASQVHAFIEPLLAAGCRVISFDGPAHGNSPGRQTSIMQLADAMLALQDRYGPLDGVITHSFGGMVLAFAARFGFRARRAVLICPPDGVDVLLENFANALALPAGVRQAMFDRMYLSYGQVLKHMIGTVENASRVGFPALIIHDRDDAEIPWQCSENIARAWPRAELKLTGGLGHHRILRDAAVVEATVDYLG